MWPARAGLGALGADSRSVKEQDGRLRLGMAGPVGLPCQCDRLWHSVRYEHLVACCARLCKNDVLVLCPVIQIHHLLGIFYQDTGKIQNTRVRLGRGLITYQSFWTIRSSALGIHDLFFFLFSSHLISFYSVLRTVSSFFFSSSSSPPCLTHKLFSVLGVAWLQVRACCCRLFPYRVFVLAYY